MKRLARFLAYAVAVVVVLIALLFVASESGEVVVLTSVDESGDFHETRVWIVDIEDGTYLRAGTAESAWLERVLARPQVTLERGGERREVRLVVAAAMTATVNAHMAYKYGVADMVVGALVPRSNAVALRVVGPLGTPLAHPG